MGSFWKSRFLTLCLIALDVLAASIIWRESWEIGHYLRQRQGGVLNAFHPSYTQALPVLLAVWLVVLTLFHQYAHRGKISSLNQAGEIVKAGVGLLLGSMATAFLLKPLDLGRSVILIAPGLMTVYLYLSRTGLRALKQWLREKGIGLTRVAIIGAGETGRRVSLRIQNHPEVGYELIGFVDRRAAELGESVLGAPVIGDGTNLVETLLRYRIEEVFLAIPSIDQHEAFDLIVKCEQASVNFKIIKDDLLQVITDRVKIDDIGDFPVIELGHGRMTPVELGIKRILDLVLVSPTLLLAAPLLGLIAVMVRLDSPGPALFVHDRVGKDGRVFRLYKFRTMRSDSDPYSTAPGDQNDGRITRFGRLLRKTSLDELPQLWNVIKGDMSLVGPRPEMPFIVEKYEPWQRRRLDVPQGITGLWQIAGRKQLPLHHNLEYDFYYIRNWSLLLDVVILLRTIPAVLLGKGAF